MTISPPLLDSDVPGQQPHTQDSEHLSEDEPPHSELSPSKRSIQPQSSHPIRKEMKIRKLFADQLRSKTNVQTMNNSASSEISGAHPREQELKNGEKTSMARLAPNLGSSSSGSPSFFSSSSSSSSTPSTSLPSLLPESHHLQSNLPVTPFSIHSQKRMSPSHGSSNSNTTKGKSPQIYTRRQEKFIAQQLAAPQNWGLLSGLKLEGATNGNKTDLRKVLLMEVNALFLLSLDDKQLKNKIMTMESSWKKAHQEYIKIDDNGPLALSLKANVMKLCHFYDILYPAASKSLKLNPSGTQKPLINMCYKGAGGDEDDDNNEAKSGDAGESENEDEYESGHDSNDGDGIAEVTLPELKGKPQELEPVTKQSTRNVMTGALVERINQRQDWPNPHNRWQHERESQLAIRQTQLATKRLEFEEKRLDMERQHMLYNDDMDRRMKAIHEKITIAGLKKAEAEEEAAKEQLKLKRLEVELKEVEIEQMKARIKAGVDAETVERETHITPIRNNKRKSNTLSEIPVD